MSKFPFLWLILACGAVWAQPKGHIEGTVSGEDGEALYGASIAVRGPSLPDGTGSISSEEGRFRIALPAGTYEVEITYVGYRTERREEVQVRAGETTRLNALLAEQVLYLGQEVVTASRRQEKILDAPASVSVVEGGDVRNKPALTVADHVKDLPAVDFARTGLATNMVVVRGFNNIFSADGVMHVITRSPLTSQGTNVYLGLGERDLRKTEMRHAGRVGDDLGYKLSARYYTGTEWEYTDREEVEARQRRQAKIAAGADLPSLKERDPDTRNQSLEARLDWRASEDLTAILAAGHNEASILGLTGVGASQTVDWQYNYTQLRLLYGDWFLQAFRNRAALVFKPRETQTLRLTYNRAFSTPTSNNLYLDLQTSRDPFGLGPTFSPVFAALGLGEFRPIDVWTQGNYRDSGYGFTFRRDENGRPLFRSRGSSPTRWWWPPTCTSHGSRTSSAPCRLAGLLTAGAAPIPYGTVSPEQASDPYAMVMSYRNFEAVTIRGLDLSLAWYPTDRLRLTGNYSFVDDNWFENLQYAGAEGGADVALNAPRHKTKLGADCDFAGVGLTVGGRMRYTDSFRMSSGVYAGVVDTYTVLDLNLTWQLPLQRDLVLQVDASNVLAPEVGRLVFGQAAVGTAPRLQT